MIRSAFTKLFWGFVFIMIDIQISGFDILPDIVGFILFAIAISQLVTYSQHFVSAQNFNLLMILLSIVAIFITPLFTELIWVVAIAAFVLTLLVVYHVFMGIKDAVGHSSELHDEAGKRWYQFLGLHLAVFVIIIFTVIFPLAIVLIITLFVLNFMYVAVLHPFLKKCGEKLDMEK